MLISEEGNVGTVFEEINTSSPVLVDKPDAWNIQS